ncbi:MAG: DUF177 domain-containing protein [Flavobacteriaceae bacterium]
MKGLKDFNIPFVGLKLDRHLFEYKIDNTFFEAFNFDEYDDVDVTAKIYFTKKTTLIETSIHVYGTVNVPCDTTNIAFDQEIDGTLDLVVKFGPEFNDDNDGILILPHEAYQINLAQYIYELIVLSVPLKRIHPKVLDGTMQSEALNVLNDLQITKEKTIKDTETDPRWDKLKNLITEKKT